MTAGMALTMLTLLMTTTSKMLVVEAATTQTRAQAEQGKGGPEKSPAAMKGTARSASLL